MASQPPASLLSIPSELRNVIYLYLFNPEGAYERSTYNDPQDPIAAALKPQFDNNSSTPEPCAPRHLSVLQTCRQIHKEAHLLALSLTAFHVVGEASHPERFAEQFQMRDAKVAAIRHLMLTAKISHLRAMNETWGGLPFGQPSLELETLTIVPTRPDASSSAYRDIAHLSQGSTLAYILGETVKCLKNVRCVIVKNRGCFDEGVWRVVYRSLVYQIWRWGGGKCGIRFECCNEKEVALGDEWFRVWLQDGEEGSEVGEEVMRFFSATGFLPDPSLLDV